MTGKRLEPGQIEAAAERPPFIQLPPRTLFALRAGQLDTLATDHPLGEYLGLLAGVCRAQQQVLDQPPPGMPPLDARRTRESLGHGLPPLATDTLVREAAWQVMLDAWLDVFYTADNPSVRTALARLHRADEAQRRAWGVALLAGQYEGVPAALVPFLGAGLQLAWSHWLFELGDALARPEPAETTHCPCCGAPPMAGVIRHRGALSGLRYLVCSLCAAEWHFVRLKCSQCLSTRQLDYVHRDGTPGDVKAEACPACHGYLKLLYLEKRTDGECLSADLASLELDMLMNEQGFHRLAPNLLLAPGGEG